MQPNLLSPEKEENQSESLSSEATLPERPSNEKVADATPSPTVKKKNSKAVLAYAGLGVLVLLLIAAIGWVGYWAYDLSNQLTGTQQQLAMLQADYAQLQSDHEALKSEKEKLTSELAQVKADLVKTNADLVAAQTDLATSRDQKNDLSNKITKAGKLAEILYIWINMNGPGDLLKVDGLVNESNNKVLQQEWANFAMAGSEEAFGKFLEALIPAIRDSLK